jgi:hypothetical protein
MCPNENGWQTSSSTLRLKPYLMQILMNTTFAKLLRGLLGNRHHITIYFATGDGQFVG